MKLPECLRVQHAANIETHAGKDVVANALHELLREMHTNSSEDLQRCYDAM